MQTQPLTLDSNTVVNSSSRQTHWLNRILAFVALFSLILVIFNLSYIPLRDIYLKISPRLVQIVDPLKGIEPHPVTQTYLATVDRLENQIANTSLSDPTVLDLITELRQQSDDILDENPFIISAKFGTFAKIQRLMRQHTQMVTARAAFDRFWTPETLTPDRWQTQLFFFEQKIRPLIETNYFRNVNDYGQFIDEFWRMDNCLMGFFALEFLIRTLFISYRTPGINWLDAMLRRWYDLFLFLPFWRGLRVLPVIIRLHQAGIINLNRAIAQITHEPASQLADRVSKFTLIRLVNQTQESIARGDAIRSLLNPQPQTYIRVNNINEIEVITDRLLRLTIYKVLPKVQPNLEALLHHSLHNAVKESDFYQTLQQLPGVGNLPADLTEQFANTLAKAAVEVLASSYSDVEGRVLFDRFSTDFSQALRLELQEEETLAEIQRLLTDLLEELKLNYITRSEISDPEAIMHEVEQLEASNSI